MGIKIILDSTTNLPADWQNRFEIVPLTVHFGEQEYIDGVTISAQRFYEMLVEYDTLPTTSQPTPAAFARTYERALQNADQVLVLTISSKLSGTFQSAKIAAMDFPEGKIHVVDSKSVAIGTGILAMEAWKLAEAGTAIEEIVAALEQQQEKLCLIALVDTLEYLQKGGRLSKTAAFAGTLLSIKPVVCVTDGEVRVLGKARGSRQGNNLLVQEIQKAGGVDFQKPVLLGYTGLSDALLNKYLQDSYPLWQSAPALPECCIIGSVIGTHVGPGAVAAAFFQNA